MFFSRLTLCADFYSVPFPPPCYRSGTQKTPVILPKVQVAGYIPKCAHTSFTHQRQNRLTMPLSRHCVGKCQDNELTRNSSGNTRPQSSHLAEPLLTDPGLKSEFSVHKLISTLSKNVQAGNEWSNLLPKFSQTRKKPPPSSVRASYTASYSAFLISAFLVNSVSFCSASQNIKRRVSRTKNQLFLLCLLLLFVFYM